jgi:hypothetical protein
VAWREVQAVAKPESAPAPTLPTPSNTPIDLRPKPAPAPIWSTPADAISEDQRGAIADHVRACLFASLGVPENQRVVFNPTTDANGIARRAEVNRVDIDRMNDPQFRAFADRAVRAVLDPRCAKLPLPASLLGRAAGYNWYSRTITVRSL